MSSEFHSFEKMCSSSNELGPIPKAVMKEKWVVLEKIHGANFSFTIDQHSIRPGRRTGFLDVETENFFGLNATDLLERMQAPLRQAFLVVTREFPQAHVVTIYGELFGGIYDHPDVPEVAGVVPVQVEIQYCPDLRFKAYDVTVEGPELPRDYLDYDVVMRLLEEAGVDFVRPYLIGSMEEALHFDIARETLLPRSFGLPYPPMVMTSVGQGKGERQKSNLIEGVVVKPVKNAWVEGAKGRKRVIVKVKNDAYLETQLGLYKQEKREKDRMVMANQGGGGGKQNAQDVELLKEEMRNLTTRNRLINTISKVGNISEDDGDDTGGKAKGGKAKGGKGGKSGNNSSKGNREKVEEMLAKEILQETRELVGEVMDRCAGPRMAEVERWLRGEVAALVDQYLAAQSTTRKKSHK